MFQTLINALKNKEVRTKLLVHAAHSLHIQSGLLDPRSRTRYQPSGCTVRADENVNTFLSLLNGITGDALQNGALLALGISPYINASIIAQLLTIAIPALERWSKQGDEGKRKMAMFTRVLTVVLAVIQAVGIVYSFGSAGYLSAGDNNVVLACNARTARRLPRRRGAGRRSGIHDVAGREAY